MYLLKERSQNLLFGEASRVGWAGPVVSVGSIRLVDLDLDLERIFVCWYCLSSVNSFHFKTKCVELVIGGQLNLCLSSRFLNSSSFKLAYSAGSLFGLVILEAIPDLHLSEFACKSISKTKQISANQSENYLYLDGANRSANRNAKGDSV